MKSLLTIIALVLIAAPAAAQTGLDGYNAIGVYLVPDITEIDATGYVTYLGPHGTFEAYVVLTAAANLDYGGAGGTVPITHLGGFEFRLVLPAGVVLLGAELPPGSNAVNVMEPPSFQVGCNIAVTGWATTLVHLTLAWSGPTYCDLLYLAPVLPESHQAIPGMLAVTDYDDAFRLSPAFPSSGDLDAPVFYLGCGDPAADTTWGEVKSLYR